MESLTIWVVNAAAISIYGLGIFLAFIGINIFVKARDSKRSKALGIVVTIVAVILWIVGSIILFWPASSQAFFFIYRLDAWVIFFYVS